MREIHMPLQEMLLDISEDNQIYLGFNHVSDIIFTCNSIFITIRGYVYE